MRMSISLSPRPHSLSPDARPRRIAGAGTGALIGGATGAVIGGAAGGTAGSAVAGGLIGAAGGAIIGAATTPRYCRCAHGIGALDSACGAEQLRREYP